MHTPTVHEDEEALDKQVDFIEETMRYPVVPEMGRIYGRKYEEHFYTTLPQACACTYTKVSTASGRSVAASG